MKNNWLLDLLIGLAVTDSILWLVSTTPNKTKHKPRRSGSRRAKYIGSIKLDPWALEAIESLDNEKDLDLCFGCTGDFYVFNHCSEKKLKTLTKGITADLEKVWEISIPVKNLKDLKTATAATVYCKYKTTATAFVDGLIKVTKRED